MVAFYIETKCQIVQVQSFSQNIVIDLRPDHVRKKKEKETKRNFSKNVNVVIQWLVKT